MSDDPVFDSPPWSERVRFSASGGGFAYVPNTAIVRDSADSTYKFSSVVLGIVKSPAFQMNQKTGTSGSGPVASR